MVFLFNNRFFFLKNASFKLFWLYFTFYLFFISFFFYNYIYIKNCKSCFVGKDFGCSLLILYFWRQKYNFFVEKNKELSFIKPQRVYKLFGGNLVCLIFSNYMFISVFESLLYFLKLFGFSRLFGLCRLQFSLKLINSKVEFTLVSLLIRDENTLFIVFRSFFNWLNQYNSSEVYIINFLFNFYFFDNRLQDSFFYFFQNFDKKFLVEVI